jgi:HAMP domain-containing protein
MAEIYGAGECWFTDEIGDLTVNFNQMTQSLKLANDELCNYAENWN